MKPRFILLLFSLLIAAPAAQGLDPRWKFRVLSSPHFELIYREDQKDLAKRYIRAAEQSHEILMPIFKEGPAKTYIVLQDDTDISNGLADFLPYPHMIVYPVLPTQNDSIDDFGDWPLEVILHEYAHILNMYPAHGIYWPFKYLLGSVVRPNAVLPRWYLEGLAVDLESRFTDHGRLRSPDTGAAARAYALGDKFKQEDIASINEAEGKSWPYGGRPYLFGGWWWDEAHKKKGNEVIYTLNQNFSRRLPFFINGPIREQLGASAGEFFHQALNTVATRAREQMGAVKAAGTPLSHDLLDGTGDALAFAMSPSGMKLVYWLGIVDKGSFAFIRERDSAAQSFKERKAKKLFRSVATYRVTWLNDDAFVFDQVDAYAPRVNYRDIYRYDVKSDTTTRLTTGARAQDPAVSPNQQLIAFIKNDGGRNHLALMNSDGKNQRILISGNLNQRMASPEFISDTEVIFTGRVKNGDEKIYAYNLSTGKRQLWNSQLTNAQSLRRTPAGVLVSDAGTGIRNVYQVSATGAQAVSNTFTSIQFADYDPHSKALIVNELTPQGPRLKTFPLQKSQPPKIALPQYEVTAAPPVEKVKIQDESFWPIEYMRPRYLIPMIYPVEGGLMLQALSTGRDPIGRNTLGLSGSYDTVTQKPSYGLGFSNRSFRTGIDMGYSSSVSYLAASERIVESQDASLGLSGNLGSRYTAWTLSGVWSETEGRSTIYRRFGPAAGFEYSGLQSPYNDRWSWHFEANHRQFLEQDGYMAYGRSYAQTSSVVSLGRHKVGLQVRGAVAPELPFRYILDLGDRSVGGNYLVNLANSQFLMRGYPTGAFIGRKIVNANLEWVFPASDIAAGYGTFPLFFRNLELAFFADTIAIDGAAFHTEFNGYIRSHLREYYSGAGGEIRLNTSVAYHVPLSFIFGLYYGLKEEYGGGLSPFIGVGLGSLGPISKKTP